MYFRVCSLNDIQHFFYSCDLCGSLFHTKGNLDGHKKYVHFKSLDFACTACGKSFVSNSKLQRHIKGVHEGKKVS